MQEEDFDWFVENYDDLYDMYGRCFIGIKNKRIIGAYKTFHDAVVEASKIEPVGSFIVQYCNGDESAYTAQIVSMNFMG